MTEKVCCKKGGLTTKPEQIHKFKKRLLGGKTPDTSKKSRRGLLARFLPLPTCPRNLGQTNQGIVLATEDWEAQHALPLPAQFLMESSRMVAERDKGIRYRLASLWPIYRKNTPATNFEKKGLESVLQNPDTPYYGVVKSGKRQFFQAIYADRAVAEACVVCHNTHPMSPKRDFQKDGVMGGLVITIPLH